MRHPKGFPALIVLLSWCTGIRIGSTVRIMLHLPRTIHPMSCPVPCRSQGKAGGDPYKVRELLLGVILCRPRGFQLQILHDHSSSSNLSWRARISTATIITRNKMRQSGLMQWIVSLPL